MSFQRFLNYEKPTIREFSTYEVASLSSHLVSRLTEDNNNEKHILVGACEVCYNCYNKISFKHNPSRSDLCQSCRRIIDQTNFIKLNLINFH